MDNFSQNFVFISDHSLKIEIGRYRNIPKEQRLCDNCKVIDNERHFSSIYTVIRTKY